VTLQITLLNIYCTLILSLWFRNLSGCKIDVYSVHRCGSESYTCVLHIADWITFVFWNLKQRTTLKTISFGVAWSQNPCGSRRLELIPRFMMPGFRLFKATLKLGMRQGSEGQTRAQRQGDFMDKSNNYLLYTVSVAMISKFVRLQNWSYKCRLCSPENMYVLRRPDWVTKLCLFKPRNTGLENYLLGRTLTPPYVLCRC